MANEENGVKIKIPLDATQRLIRAASVVVMILSALVIVFTGTFRYAVRGPEDTVKKFFAECNALNFDGILACLDPVTAKEYKFAVDLLGGLSGLGIDSETVSDLGGMFSKYNDNEMKVLDMRTEYIKDGKKVKDPFGIQKLTATEAEVLCTYIMSGQENTDTFKLSKYGGKWKIEGK